MNRTKERKEFLGTEGGDLLKRWRGVIKRVIRRQEPRKESPMTGSQLTGQLVRTVEEKKEPTRERTKGEIKKEGASERNQLGAIKRELVTKNQGKILSCRKKTKTCGLGPLKSRRKPARAERIQLIKTLPLGMEMKKVLNPYSSLHRTEQKYRLPVIIPGKDLNLPMVKVTVEDYEWTALLDTGASRSFIHLVCVGYFRNYIRRIRKEYSFSCAFGKEVSTNVGIPNLKITLGNQVL